MGEMLEQELTSMSPLTNNDIVSLPVSYHLIHGMNECFIWFFTCDTAFRMSFIALQKTQNYITVSLGKVTSLQIVLLILCIPFTLEEDAAANWQDSLCAGPPM